MKFIDLYLQSGEEIKYKAKLHSLLFFQPAFILLLGIVTISSADIPTLQHGGILILFLGFILLLQRIFIKVSSQFLVTNRRVIVKKGMMGYRVTELELAKCEGVGVNQNLLGRLLNYGTLCITAGSLTKWYCYVEDPFSFKREIETQMENE